MFGRFSLAFASQVRRNFSTAAVAPKKGSRLPAALEAAQKRRLELAARTPEQRLADSQEKVKKLYEQQNLLSQRLSVYVARKPRKETTIATTEARISNYRQKLEALKSKIERAESSLRNSKKVVERAHSAAVLPSAAELQKMTLAKRLALIIDAEPRIRSAPNLYARQAALLETPNLTLESLRAGFKALSEADRKVFEKTILDAKARRAAAPSSV